MTSGAAEREDMQLRVSAARAESGRTFVLDHLQLERHDRMKCRVSVKLDGAAVMELAALAGVVRPDTFRKRCTDQRWRLFATTVAHMAAPLVRAAVHAEVADPRFPCSWVRPIEYGHVRHRPFPPRLTLARGAGCACGCTAAWALDRADVVDVTGHLCDAVFTLTAAR